ncbi:MAG: formylmethanofuran dehydrogenase subunit C, partial [Rhodospirillaceae bacterium]|nr:formylmethanofuran dehydrogenase subunit C [Rhodospirillaceae bacterium]
MSALVLTLRARPPQRVDLSPLTPARLREAGDVARVELA